MRQLNFRLRVMPTALGALYACSSPRPSKAQKFLKRLLSFPESKPLNDALLSQTLPGLKQSQQHRLIDELQSKGLLHGSQQIQELEVLSFTRILERRIKQLSSEQKGLICRADGLCLAAVAVSEKEAGYYGALSFSLAELNQKLDRHRPKQLGAFEPTWRMMDMQGQRAVNFWPLYIGRERLVLVLFGEADLSQKALMELIWAMTQRYEKP